MQRTQETVDGITAIDSCRSLLFQFPPSKRFLRMTIDFTKTSSLSDDVPRELYLPSHIIKVVEVAKKYAGPEVSSGRASFDRISVDPNRTKKSRGHRNIPPQAVQTPTTVLKVGPTSTQAHVRRHRLDPRFLPWITVVIDREEQTRPWISGTVYRARDYSSC